MESKRKGLFFASLFLILLISSCTGIKYTHDLSKKKSLPIIYNALESGSSRDKIAAVRALGLHHEGTRGVKGRLVKASADNNWKVSFESSVQLIRLGYKSEGARALIEMKAHRSWKVCLKSSLQLIRSGYYTEGIKGLMELATHRDAGVRLHAIRHIERQGRRSEFALPLLRSMTTNNPLGVEKAAKSAIAKIESAVIVHNLTRKKI